MSNNDGLDTRIQQLYQRIPKEQPSATIDTAILQAAQQAIKTKTYWRPVWGIAASLLMMSSLVWYWQAQQPDELARAVAVSAPAPQAKPAETPHTKPNEAENAVIAADDFGDIAEQETNIEEPKQQTIPPVKAKLSTPKESMLADKPVASAPAPVVAMEQQQNELDSLAEVKEEKQVAAKLMASPRLEGRAAIKEDVGQERLSAQNLAKDATISTSEQRAEQVKHVFQANFAQLNMIYQQARKGDPKIQSGLIRLKLSIDKKGLVVECKIEETNFNHPDLENKIIETVKKFKFGEATEEWEGRYIIEF